MRIAVVVFPGTNCDQETLYVLGAVLGQDAEPVWHADTDLARFDAIVLPGGFSYGDHLRAGAIARFSPVMRSVAEQAKRDRIVVGICNGFQVLCEAGLLPGALLPNAGGAFASQWVHCRVESEQSALTAGVPAGTVLRLPIAHGEGRYVAPPETLAELESSGRVIFRYADAVGAVTDASNPNGSLGNIAGIASAGGNVVGLMPHPERAAESELPSQDGLPLLRALISYGSRAAAHLTGSAAHGSTVQVGAARTGAASR
ncbi:MAG: phosphoribosylformylglycinamidine synthase I [Chloroflexi bacterium]|nr:phosphoribosylformylglycinamidine synthase I [Chloroflexota bacterium]